MDRAFAAVSGRRATACARLVVAALLLGPAFAGALAETLTGQVVCSQCWFEADRATTPYGTAADLDCAARCAKAGVASAVAVRDDDGEFKLYLLQGTPPGGGAWLDWTGRFVSLEGTLEEDADTTAFSPTALAPLEKSPWPEPARDEHEVELAWTDLRGRAMHVRDLGERIVVVNFWATWCKPCIKEMPELIRLHDRFAAYGVEFVGAAADDPSQLETVLRYVDRHEINFPVALGATTDQMRSVGLPPVLPGTAVLDEHGHALERFPGVIDPDELEATLSRMLGLAGDGSKAKPATIAQARPRHQHRATHASLVPS